MSKEEDAMKLATFRFGVISEFVTGVRLEYGEKEKLIAVKANRVYQIPGSERTRISKSTIMYWVSAYKKAGFKLEGLTPKERRDKGTYRKLDMSLRMAIKELKLENPHYTVPVIITKLKHQKILSLDDTINKASVYRYIINEKLDQPQTESADHRKYEAPYPNEIWQCDIMHGPLMKVEGSPNKKTYLCAIMDDHSRLIVHAQFYLNETIDTLKDCLKQALEKRGLPAKFYVDNGACYRAVHLEQILAGLGIALTHSRPYIPEGRGKIERWFRYVRQDFIPLYAEKPLFLEELNQRLDGWVDKYSDTAHGTTKISPYERFKKNLAMIRPAPHNIADYFRLIEQRRVRKDRTVQLNTKLFEVPTGLVDKRIELRFHENTSDEVEIFYENRSYGKAVVLDPHVNARIGRDYEYTVSGKKSEIKSEPQVTAQPTGQLFGQINVENANEQHL